MKKNYPAMQYLLLSIAFLFISFCRLNAQSSWMKSSNNGLYYQTNARFTWSGGGFNGYCNGIGTIQWYNADGTKTGWYTGKVVNGKNEGYGAYYYSNGQPWYEGYWKNDQKNGYGKMYFENGAIQFEGNFINDQLEGIGLLELAGNEAGKLIMDKLFDGGINLQTSIVRSTPEEVMVYVKFNGNINTANLYEFILAVGKKTPSVKIPYMNDLAKFYLTLKGISVIAAELDKIFSNN
jgi:hypothetical protein